MNNELDDFLDYQDIDALSSLEDADEAVGEEQTGDGTFPEPLYQLKLEYSQETFYATHDSIPFQGGDYVVVPTRYGEDVAKVMGIVQKPIGTAPKDIAGIIRKITDDDSIMLEENAVKEKAAAQLFKEKVLAHKLDMKLIGCHYLLKESKVLFFFSADNRIDFRKLVKDLVAILHVRIELRQIGVRDESRIVGGLGCCGRPFCCHSITDKLRPVSIKMAKEQNLSLNSLKISGQCGRLLCCLAYEHDWYSEAKKHLPPIGTTIFYDTTLFRITEINLITGMAVLSGEDGRCLSVPGKRFVHQHGKWKIKD